MMTISYLDTVPVDRTTVAQALLDISDKKRTNPLPWNGQFSPQLVQVLLDHFAGLHDHILDPFVGSGTVLHEAALKGLPATGAELNPAAVLLASVYTLSSQSQRERQAAVAAIEATLAKYVTPGPLFGNDVCESPLKVVADAHEVRSGNERVLWGALTTLCDFSAATTWSDVVGTWHRIRQLVLTLPQTAAEIQVLHSDARSLPLGEGSVDLVITSPPYINVFNYHQKYRKSVEALGWDILSVARSEIGSNRKHRGNRFLTVIQYCLDMCLALAECIRVSRPGARIIFIVGRESTVRGAPFRNGALVAEVAKRALGMPVVLRQERCFGNRFGQNIYEDILHFDASAFVTPDALALREARALGVEALRNVHARQALEGISQAIEQSERVEPSPILCAKTYHAGTHNGSAHAAR